jgi:FXSXX-COOH protein
MTVLPGEPTSETPGPERVPLVRLAARPSGVSPALTRVVAANTERGPARVTVAGFQSAL